MLGRDVMDKLHDENRLADARTAEEANLAAARVRGDEVDDFDARLKDLRRRLLLIELRSRTMDRPRLLVADGSGIVVDRAAEHVENAPEARIADGHLDRRARIFGFHAAHEAIRRAHGDAARDTVAEMLHDFDDEVDVEVFHLTLDRNGIEDGRQLSRWKFDIYDRSDDLYHFTFSQC